MYNSFRSQSLRRWISNVIHILVSFPQKKNGIHIKRERAHRFVMSKGRTPEGHQLGRPLKKFSRSTKLSQLGPEGRRYGDDTQKNLPPTCGSVGHSN